MLNTKEILANTKALKVESAGSYKQEADFIDKRLQEDYYEDSQEFQSIITKLNKKYGLSHIMFYPGKNVLFRMELSGKDLLTAGTNVSLLLNGEYIIKVGESVWVDPSRFKKYVSSLSNIITEKFSPYIRDLVNEIS